MTATVLVVDDIEPNRRLLQAKLEAKYYTVVLADNGQRGIESAVRHQPDIILLDVMMPGMDGYEVCRRLKSMPQTRHIPIVMVTALVNVEDRLKGLQSGADDFLSKPVDDFGLFTRIEAQMRFNLVANELRVRGKGNTQVTQFSEYEKELIDAPSNVLVIDQDNVEARRIAAALKAMGHTAVTWIDASEGSIEFRDLDLVIVALSGQSHDALKLCAHLRTLKAARDFSILVTYDPSDQNRALEALRIGAADLISTPLEMAELQVRVRTQTHRQRYIDVLRHRVDRGMELSVIDPLTGLFNRRHMLERMQVWMQRSLGDTPPLTVVSFDIDHFKSINDRFGHEAGDDVLRAFSERLRMNIRPKDIACRTGGEEFLVIMPETELPRALKGAERIRHAIANEPFITERTGQAVEVTVSAGVASHQGESELLADLLHRADMALYQAKQNGRNRIENLAA